jgi:uncharacterized heparinase superfamily protein
MQRLSISERVRLAAIGADRTRRAAIAQALGSPLLRWRYGSPAADHLLIVPQDLRTADPSLWHEIKLGQFGLAGAIAHTGDQSPFEIVAPTDSWTRALHGFGWLRHLAAVESEDARALAQRLALEWTVRHGGGSGVSGEPAVAGRRLISWLSHASLLLDEADSKTYDALTESLGRQLVRLSASWRDVPPGHPRLLALTALVLADLCIAGHDRQLEGAEKAYSDELTRQILSDGGHVSRNPAVLVELMLDFLPLRQCFIARDRPVPPAMIEAMARMLKMLRHLRLGDGRLARFNGMGVASPAALATVLAYGDSEGHPDGVIGASRYVRMERGGAIVLVDVGSPPPIDVSGDAHAGTLSFEMSVGNHLLFANGGAPGPSDQGWRAVSRATASHSTLELDEKSSSQLVRHAGLEAMTGGVPMRGPEQVQATLMVNEGALLLDSRHDGYLGRHGLLHRRRLTLAASGRRIDGEDWLVPPRGPLRLKRDLPFAIHFHLHPEVRCTEADLASATLLLPDGACWRFTCEGTALSVEESIHFSDSSGPRHSLQLVLRATTPGESEVRWRAEAID